MPSSMLRGEASNTQPTIPISILVKTTNTQGRNTTMKAITRIASSESSKDLITTGTLICMKGTTSMTISEHPKVVLAPSIESRMVGQWLRALVTPATETRSGMTRRLLHRSSFLVMTSAANFLTSMRNQTLMITILNNSWIAQHSQRMVTCLQQGLDLVIRARGQSTPRDSRRSTWLRVWMSMQFSLQNLSCFITCWIKATSEEKKQMS